MTTLSFILAYAVMVFFIGYLFIIGVGLIPEFAENIPEPPTPPEPPETGGILGSLTAFANTVYYFFQNIGYFFSFLFFTSGYEWLRMMFITPIVVGMILIILALVRGVSI